MKSFILFNVSQPILFIYFFILGTSVLSSSASLIESEKLVSNQQGQPELLFHPIDTHLLSWLQRSKRFRLDDSDNNRLSNELSALEATAVDFDDLGGLFKLSPNTIIRAKDSQDRGAKFLNNSAIVYSNHDCMQLCVQQFGCNLAVFENKRPGACYLFDCGSPARFFCVFTKHGLYSSSLLKTAQPQFDHVHWTPQEQKHEQELNELRNNMLKNGDDADRLSVNSGQPEVKPVDFVNNKEIHNSIRSPSLADQSTVAANGHSPTKSVNHCQHFQYACRNSTECIAIYNVCDGIVQCPDGSDEAPILQCNDADKVDNVGVTNDPINTAAPFVNRKPDIALGPGQLHYNYPKMPDFVHMEGLLQQQQIQQQLGQQPGNNVQSPGLYYPNSVVSKFDLNWPSLAYGANSPLATSYMPTMDPLSVAMLQSQRALGNNVDGKSMTDASMQPYYVQANADQNEQRRRMFQNLAQQQYLQNMVMRGNEWQKQAQESVGKDQPTTNVNYNKNQIKEDNSTPIPIQSTKFKDIEANEHKDSNKESRAAFKSLNDQSAQSTIIGGNKFNINPQLVSYDFSQTSGRSGHRKNSSSGRILENEPVEDTNSAVIALTLGLVITAILLFTVVYRIKSIRRKIMRRGGRNLSYDADYLVNGMYL